jgi:hypothetical protein
LAAKVADEQTLTTEQQIQNQAAELDIEAPAEVTVAANSPLPEETPQGHAHPAWLVRMAQEQGFTDEEITATDPNLLGDQIQRINTKVQRRLAEERARLPHREQTTYNAPQREAPALVEDEVSLGSLEQQLAPELTSELKRVLGNNLKRVKEVEKKLAASEKRDLERRNRQIASQFDNAIASLGKPYEKIFGVGTGADVERSNPEAFARRVQVFQRTLKQIGQDTGLIASEVAFQARALYPVATTTESSKTEEADPLNKTRKDWMNGTVAKPTARRNAPEPPSDGKAVRSVEALLREMGTGDVTSANPEQSGTATKDDFFD